MVEIAVLQIGITSKLSAVLSLVEKAVQWPYKLHATLLSNELYNLSVDGFIRCLQAELLPSSTDIGISNRCKLVKLIHLGDQVVRQGFSVSQTLEEDH